ncbi:MAG: hypothetical protein Q8P15_00825 [Nanoarchaeota archaeon]|nr:hypothetical protein [Nanoarchaeota archaeon]
MIKLSKGKIRLEEKILDFTNFEIRKRITEQDLEKYYDCFIEYVEEIGDYFENKNAFEKAVRDSTYEKRPKLIAREPRYPFLFGLKTSFMPFDFLKPSERRLHKDYFIGGNCITAIPKNKSLGSSKGEKPLDRKLKEDIVEKFKKYPGYEGIIEIPDDGNIAQAKASTFHEALHYVVLRYQSETDRNFVNAFIKEELSDLERYQTEYIIHETAVEILTDKLLAHDSDAQFENRWNYYSLTEGAGFRHGIMMFSAITTGTIIGFSISNPQLLPFALIPGRARDYFLKKYKQSTKDRILIEKDYPKFKI